MSVREALDAAAAKIDAGAMAKQPEVEIAVRNVIGTTYGSLGLFEPAERQLRAALDLRIEDGASPLRARRHPCAAGGTALRRRESAPRRNRFAREALRLRRETLGPKHADVATQPRRSGRRAHARRRLTGPRR